MERRRHGKCGRGARSSLVACRALILRPWPAVSCARRAGLFAILDELEAYRRHDNSFVFKLVWPESDFTGPQVSSRGPRCCSNTALTFFSFGANSVPRTPLPSLGVVANLQPRGEKDPRCIGLQGYQRDLRDALLGRPRGLGQPGAGGSNLAWLCSPLPPHQSVAASYPTPISCALLMPPRHWSPFPEPP